MDGTILISFLDTEDIRCEGHVAIRRTIRVEPSDQYAEGIQRVADAAQTLIADALDDWSGSSSIAAGPSERPLPAQSPTELSAQSTGQDDEDEPDSLAERRKWAAIEAARI